MCDGVCLQAATLLSTSSRRPSLGSMGALPATILVSLHFLVTEKFKLSVARFRTLAGRAEKVERAIRGIRATQRLEEIDVLFPELSL